MTRSINISLSAQTIDALKNANYALYVMKAVKYGFKGVPFRPTNGAEFVTPGYGGGASLAWRVLADYLQRTSIQWETAVEAYVSASPITDQQRIVPGSETSVALGQTVKVSAGGGLSVASGGGEGAVAIVNQGVSSWTCGLAETARGGPAPTCAFPLYGGAMVVLTPQDRVLLMFTSNLLPTGSVITTAYSSGLLVDASGGDRSVSFDINQGWSAGAAAWATTVAPEADLSLLLVTT